MSRIHLIFLSLGLFIPAIPAAELTVDSRDMPRIPATEPADVLKTFKVKPGFKLELVAHEPLVIDPITMCFDEHGRLFVIEMIDYSERREEKPHLGRVRMLVDTDADGKFDQSTVYADNLPWPTALVCYDGGLFIGATPDIFWVKDKDGDGKADERKVVFTGFAGGVDRLNVQALFNSFQWGIDGRIHGSCGTTGGNLVKRAGDASDQGISMRRVDFSFDPRNLDLRSETGGGQYGMSFDSQGRKFMCSNSSHAQHSVYDYRYLGRNQYYSMPSPQVAIAREGGAAEVFRLSSDEPWRVIRTRWRISGVVRGSVEGGGRVSGYFTGATGITVYKGNALGAGFSDNLFVGDAGGNLVHRKIVDENGIDLIAHRPDDEQKLEFIASTDNWFRPVHFQNGPDGCLYIADMYRETIEHPWSIPEEIKRHLDLNSGNDRGRIYRIVPDGFKHPGEVRLAYYRTPMLVATLEHANGWHRETAARLLLERADRRAVPHLANLLARSREPLARLHALHVLSGMLALSESHLMASFNDRDDRVREHAIRLSESFFGRGSQRSPLFRKLLTLGGDESPRVRLQLALTMSMNDSPEKSAALAAIMKKDASSKWIRAAVINALQSGAGDLFFQLARDPRFLRNSGATTFLTDLAMLIGRRAQTLEIKEVLDYLGRGSNLTEAAQILAALNSGLAKTRKSASELDVKGRLNELRARAGESLSQDNATDAERIAAMRFVAAIGGAGARKELLAVVDAARSAGSRKAALALLIDSSDSAVPREILNRWEKLDADSRQSSLVRFLNSASHTASLLGAVEKGLVKKGDFSPYQIQSLRGHKTAAVKKRAEEIFGKAVTVSLKDLQKKYQSALTAKGDPAAGAKIFTERCVSCHRANGQGHLLGPDMVTVKTTGREKLLMNILSPSAEVAPQYLAFTIDTSDGESYEGVIAAETPTRVTLRQASGIEQKIVRTAVKGMKSGGKSLMPEELYKDLSAQQMADLLEFIEQVK